MLPPFRFFSSLLILLLLPGCSRTPAGNPPDRLAIFAADLLTADPSSDWIRLALPLVLQEDLAASRSVVTFFANDGSAAYEGQAREVLRTVAEERNGRIRLECTVTDLRTQKNREVIEARADAAAGILDTLNGLAKKIDPGAADFPTRSLPVLKAFAAAVFTPDLSQRLRLLSEAVSDDPAFGLAHLALAETTAQAAPQNLPAVIAAGTAQHDRFAPLERSRWNLLAARYNHAPLEQQAALAAGVLAIAPHNVDALATLGADRFLQGRGAEGERNLREAIALSPGNVALQLQLANGLIEAKRFDEAISVLRPLSGSPAAIPTLATAMLLGGKAKEATETFQSLINALPSAAPQTSFLHDQWQAITTTSGGNLRLPGTPSLAGYSAFSSGHFEEAAQFWRRAVQETGDTDLRARAMLAASLKNAGHTAEAGKITVLPFVPDFGDAGAAVAFQQMRQLLRL